MALPTRPGNAVTDFSFAHVADLHLDTPFSGLASLNDELAARLKNASLDAWDRVVQGCLDHTVDFVVIAGDVYDSDSASVRAQLRFKDGVDRLCAEGIRVMVVHGNHDPSGGRWPAVQAWPQDVTIFGTSEVEHVEVRRGDELLAVVSGISFPERHVKENLSRRFRRTEHDAYHVAVLHTNVDGDAAHGVYAPCSLQDLIDSRHDYWALGHIHARRVLREHGPAVVYSGNIQSRHPGETGEKGFAVVQVQGGDTTLRWVETDSWRFHEVDCDVSALGSVEEIVVQLCREGERLASDRPAVLRARIGGSTALHATLSRSASSLLEGLRDLASRDLWWDHLRVSTRPPFDREVRAQGEDFTADLLRQVDRADAPALVSGLLRELQGAAALSKVGHHLDLESLLAEAPELLREAEALALGLLEGDAL